MTYQERHRIWCDEHGVEFDLFGTLTREVIREIQHFNEEHETCIRSITRTADIDREEIIAKLVDHRDLALTNAGDDYAKGYIAAMQNAITIVGSDK